MQKIQSIFIVAILLSTQAISATPLDNLAALSKPCTTVAKACKDAGYATAETKDKRFWQDCMKPIILGQSVQGVTIDAATIKACRATKIDDLKSDLQELQNAS